MITDEEISSAVKDFIERERMDGFKDAGGGSIALLHGESGWRLERMKSRDTRLKDAQTKFKYPSVPSNDELLTTIILAGFITMRINGFRRAKKANSSRSEDTKRLSAKKAITTRWNKKEK